MVHIIVCTCTHAVLHHTPKPPPVAIISAQMFADTNIPLIL